MKERIKRWRRPALFILGGALAGLALPGGMLRQYLHHRRQPGQLHAVYGGDRLAAVGGAGARLSGKLPPVNKERNGRG